MNVEDLLTHLQKVRRSGNGWLACCPAHDDRSPSLSVAVGNLGGIVLRCHAECSNESIVDALGLRMSDLMPERLPEVHAVKPTRFNAHLTLEALAYQAAIVAIAASDMSKGKTLSVEDKDRLWQIAGNIERAFENVSR